MNEDQIRETPAPSREDSLREQRRRRWKRRRSFVEAQSAGITVLVLGGLLALTALFLLVFPRSTVSEVEKRTLTPFPKFSFASYFSGEFTSGVASHYDDTVPWRDSFKNAGNRFKALFGLRSRENTVTRPPKSSAKKIRPGTLSAFAGSGFPKDPVTPMPISAWKAALQAFAISTAVSSE